MASVTLENVSKRYGGGVVAVRDVQLEIDDGELVVLAGPSGCGKTSTLRMIAGLESVTSGVVKIGGRIVNDVHPRGRDIAMVFQNYALYPHMTVYKNMAFALKLRKTPRAEIDRRVRGAAELLGLAPLLERKPRALSGGERQRVALGRAIVRQPAVFLFDEPLSNLDARLRVEMRAEIKRLHRQLNVTTVYVTHDQEEAMTLGDRVAVMHDGVVRQCDAPLTVYHRPADRFVAGFVGMPPMNFLPGRVEQSGDATWFVGAETRLRVADQSRASQQFAPGAAIAGIRPEALEIARPNVANDNRLQAVVQLVEPLGAAMDVYLLVGGQELICRAKAQTLNEGDAVTLRVPPESIRLFAPEASQT